METERMQAERIPTTLEKPFRKALGHAIRNQMEDLHGVMLALTDEQVIACLNLCAFAAGFVVIDVCGREWPDDDSLHGIARAATKSTNAREFELTQQETHDYLVRVVLGSEPIDSVFPPVDERNHDAVTLSFVITGQLLLSFHPAEIKWWDYLDIIENVYEITAVADLALLPGLMLRSRRLGSPRTFGDTKGA